MFKFSKTCLPALAVGLLAATAATSAMAGTTDWDSKAPSITVRYSDLDLSTANGRSRLYSRLEFAASKVCPGALEIGYMADSEACQGAAMRRAVHDIGGTFEAQLRSEHRILQASNLSPNG